MDEVPWRMNELGIAIGTVGHITDRNVRGHPPHRRERVRGVRDGFTVMTLLDLFMVGD